MRHLFGLMTIILLIFCTGISAVRSEDRSVLPESLQWEDVTFETKDLYDAFSYAVHVRQRGGWAYPRTFYDEQRYGALAGPSGYKTRYPWLYEYIAREKGMPDYWGIYKWTKPVTVSLGFPFDLKPAGGNEDDGQFINGSIPKDMPESLEEVAKSEVESAFTFLRRHTELSFSYLPHNAETASEYARIRIVFMDARDYCDWETKYKKVRSSCEWRVNLRPPGFSPVPFRHTVERYLLPTSVPFASSSYQVDGFILPEADNSIGMAFCFIYYKHDEAMIRGLIRECLVRSMGLAGSTGWRQTLLGNWNKTDKEESDPFSFAGPRYLNPNRGARVVDGKDLLNTIITGKTVVSEDNRLDPRAYPPDEPPPFSDFEAVMLQALYHPKVKPGMTMVELMRAMDMPLP